MHYVLPLKLFLISVGTFIAVAPKAKSQTEYTCVCSSNYSIVFLV